MIYRASSYSIIAFFIRNRINAGNLAVKDCTELGTMFKLNFKAKSTAAARSVQRRLAFLVRS